MEKLRNCLGLDYPSGKLKFVFVSDSTDRTNQILLQYQNERVKVVILPEQRGRAALESAYPLCDGEVLVFSDANTLYRPNSLRMLVRHFVDPEVGVVTGDVRLLPASQTFGQGENLYYRYERRLQEMESVFHSTVAIDGAMYALRRELLRPVSSGLIADDFVTAMNVALQGVSDLMILRRSPKKIQLRTTAWDSTPARSESSHTRCSLSWPEKAFRAYGSRACGGRTFQAPNYCAGGSRSLPY